MPTKKRLIGCYVSRETYDAVSALVEGDNRPYESLSEYLSTLIHQDLARREAGGVSIEDAVKRAMQSPEVVEMVRKIVASHTKAETKKDG